MSNRISKSYGHVFMLALAAGVALSATSESYAQVYGIELHNTLMPASGAMGGASLARPQDNLSAINGNPATLSTFSGTQFSFGAAWAEGTYNVDQLDPLPLVQVDPFSAKSGTPGTAAPNVGITQELSLGGMPAVLGIGLLTNAGFGVDFRGVPESNGTSAEYVALDFTAALAASLTDELSVGAAFTLGNSFIDGPFTDTGGMVPAYGVRGTVGVTYELYPETTIGAYWQSKKNFTFDDAVVFDKSGPFRPGEAFDLKFDHPENIGIGFADNSLMEGRLLLAADVLYKQYAETDFLRNIYKNQWVYQFGAQYAMNARVKIRCGYSYNDNPMRGAEVTSIGGIPIPDGIPGLRYIQGQFATVSKHHLTGGVSVANVLPSMDLDMLAGGMFEETAQFASTIASVKSYWVGTYFTWRFGAK